LYIFLVPLLVRLSFSGGGATVPLI